MKDNWFSWSEEERFADWILATIEVSDDTRYDDDVRRNARGYWRSTLAKAIKERDERRSGLSSKKR